MAKLEAWKGAAGRPGQRTSRDQGQYSHSEAENLDLLRRVRGRALYLVMTSIL